MMRVCSEHTGEGTIWPVDAALRPEGKAGPLVPHRRQPRGYYERWASTWEFQALLKARPVAGDRELGRAYLEAIGPLVWQAGERDGFVADVQAMRRRVEDHSRPRQVAAQLKLGPGRPARRRVRRPAAAAGARPGRRVAARAQHAGGAGRADAAAATSAATTAPRSAAPYRFLRTRRAPAAAVPLRRTHVLPDDEETRRRLGRAHRARARTRPAS